MCAIYLKTRTGICALPRLPSGQARVAAGRFSLATTAIATTLYFPAMVATPRNTDVQALYERLVDAGKPKTCAPGAAMRFYPLEKLIDLHDEYTWHFKIVII
jgi:hypothetical protein